LVILIDPDRAEDLEESERLNTRLVQRALSMDGTCSGEHGVGIGKRRFLAEEHGEAMQAMRMVKRALDPQNIMNPGKIVDLEEA
jgi:D-lactate dehydrogenase (cytochrome)